VPERRPVLLLLVAPALAMVLVLFVYPLGYSLVSAFTDRSGQPSLANFAKTFDLYGTDIAFTLVIVVASTALIQSIGKLRQRRSDGKAVARDAG